MNVWLRPVDAVMNHNCTPRALLPRSALRVQQGTALSNLIEHPSAERDEMLIARHRAMRVNFRPFNMAPGFEHSTLKHKIRSQMDCPA